jgi:ubiquinone/menaquinone biosynthesis C-methylase UbiE
MAEDKIRKLADEYFDYYDKDNAKTQKIIEELNRELKSDLTKQDKQSLYSQAFFDRNPNYSPQTFQETLTNYHEKINYLYYELGLRGKLLDVGCGVGQLLHLAESFGYETSGIDVSPHAIERCRQILKTKELYVVDIENERFPFEDASLDVVTHIGVLEHLKDYRFGFEEIARILKPGGILMVYSINGGWFGRKLNSEVETSKVNPWHLSLPTMRTMKKLFKERYETVDARSYGGVIEQVLWLRHLNETIRRILTKAYLWLHLGVGLRFILRRR